MYTSHHLFKVSKGKIISWTIHNRGDVEFVAIEPNGLPCQCNIKIRKWKFYDGDMGILKAFQNILQGVVLIESLFILVGVGEFDTQ